MCVEHQISIAGGPQETLKLKSSHEAVTNAEGLMPDDGELSKYCQYSSL